MRKISRCVICGVIISPRKVSKLPVHWVCASWWMQRTDTIFNAPIKERNYPTKEFLPAMFHHELVEALGAAVQRTSKEEVCEMIQLPDQQIAAVLSLKRAVSEQSLGLLGYRRVPIYINEAYWPLDLVEKTGNAKGLGVVD